MPEVDFTIRWADGHVQECRSPSRTIERWLAAGATYPRDELVRRVHIGLDEASERVRERFGYRCTAAAQQYDDVVREADLHGGDAESRATILRLRRLDAGDRATRSARVPSHVDVAVIGGGQAGLAVSWYLSQAGVEHVVLERDRIACSWRDARWDTFCLVTPNWQCQLPGFPYAGDDPDGFMLRDAIADYVERFAASFGPPICEGVTVQRIERRGRSGFAIATDHGFVHAHQVVLAVGGYHRPRIPALAADAPASVTQVHTSAYRNPSSLPDGAVLVVGSGQSGAQIAEDLHLAGRDVHLSLGSAPRVARFYRGRDCVAWLQDIGHYDMPIDEHPKGLGARREPNHYVTGRGGGHDIDLRAFARDGMTLHGRLETVADGGRLRFAGDLRERLDAADATAERIKDTIDQWITARDIDAPPEPRYSPVWEPAPGADAGSTLNLDAAGVRTIVWATGFSADWSWVRVPGFARDGYPVYDRGICAARDVYVVGLPWLWTWGSGRFAGIARDAEHVADRVIARARVPANRSASAA